MKSKTDLLIEVANGKSFTEPTITPARRAANARNIKKRYAVMQKAARRDGFIKASSAITAWKNGTHVLVAVEVVSKWNEQEK